MSSEKYHYEPGAIHYDHHKEINIGSVPERALSEIIKNFFKDDAEDAEYEEVKENDIVVSTHEIEVVKSFRFQSDFVKNKVADVIRDYYKGSYANLALIEITLYDHQQLIRRNYHKAFVKALISWGLLEVADEEELKKIVSAVTDKYNRMPKDGYLKWDNNHADDKSFCEKIGKELGDSMPYNG